MMPAACARRCGRVRLTGVVVRNAGIDWATGGNCYWQHKVARKEAARIVLHGQSEFEAAHVVLEGDQTFEVRAWFGSRVFIELQGALASAATVQPMSRSMMAVHGFLRLFQKSPMTYNST